MKIKIQSADTSNSNTTIVRYDVQGYATLEGNSLWDAELKYPKGMRVNLSGAEVLFEYEEGVVWSIYIYVFHDANWEIYTDSGFAKSIEKLFGFPITFTEQGMQENGIASMELKSDDNMSEFLLKWS